GAGCVGDETPLERCWLRPLPRPAARTPTASLPAVVRRLVLFLLLVAIAGASAAQAVRADDEASRFPEPEPVTTPAAVTPVLSARRVPGFLQTPAADQILAFQLASQVGAVPADACLVVA